MALDGTATLLPGNAHFFRAPVGTAMPADLLAPASPWVEIGHTSLEDIFGVSSEGGDKTTVGTLQAKQLRTSYSPRSETFNFTVMQFDSDSLKLYFGSNMVDVTSGGHEMLGVPSSPAPTEMAFLVVFVDGGTAFPFYAPSAEVLRGDDLSIDDPEALAGLPLQVTPLNYQSNAWPYAVMPIV